jgi:hypothetical protein
MIDVLSTVHELVFEQLSSLSPLQKLQNIILEVPTLACLEVVQQKVASIVQLTQQTIQKYTSFGFDI